MKKIKSCLCIALLLFVGIIFSPAGAAVAMSGESRMQKDPAGMSANDKKMLINPRFNCDPKMLIPGNPNIDPKMLRFIIPHQNDVK